MYFSTGTYIHATMVIGQCIVIGYIHNHLDVMLQRKTNTKHHTHHTYIVTCMALTNMDISSVHPIF